ncbi:MAG: hypothetical protein M3342_18705 [Bacteroidota bacterium]|nr:hypothetical protein [Bacteroidota bacterium]
MKVLLMFATFVLIGVFVFLSCNKDNRKQSPNQAPVANAGADLSLTLPSCSGKTTAELNGSGSTDPEGKTISYSWRKIAGPEGFIIRNKYGAKALVENLSVGEYAFELLVRDAESLTSKDTVLISVRSTPKEYDFDVTFNGDYKFSNNISDFYNCFYYHICNYSDNTLIQGTGTFSPLGQFTLNFSEQADSAATSYAPHSNVQIYIGNVNNTSLIGTSTVNLKKLIQQGGGAFNGTFSVTDGSAKRCDPNLFANPYALNVTGNLDTATKKVTVRVLGKTYF